MLTVKDNWERIFDRDMVGALEARLPSALLSARWYGGKARTIRSALIRDTIRLGMDTTTMVMAFLDVSYADEGRDTYTMLVSASFDEAGERIERSCPHAVVTELAVTGTRGDRRGFLHDALWEPDCACALLDAIRKGARFGGAHGTLVASSIRALSELMLDASWSAPSVMRGEQSNTSVRFGSQAMMKLYRRLEPGLNPDLEIGRVLTARGFSHSPAVLGALEYVGPADEPATVVIVQSFIENQGDAWRYTLAELERELGLIAAGRAQAGLVGDGAAPAHPSAAGPTVTTGSPGTYAHSAATLGRRTAELHLALAQGTEDPAFAPEPCTPDYWQSLHDRMKRSIEGSLSLLRRRLADLGEEDRRQAALVLRLEGDLLSRVGALTEVNLRALRIRCHGDLHLGQVLYTGRDFVMIDFEGEPARPLAERRAKHVPIVDVAGMIRSFHYAAYAALQRLRERRGEEPQPPELEQQARQWYRSAADAFLSGYTAATGETSFWPVAADEQDLLLDAHLIEKACYELGYELNNRPGWAGIPLKGILQLFESEDRRRIGSGVEATLR